MPRITHCSSFRGDRHPTFPNRCISLGNRSQTSGRNIPDHRLGQFGKVALNDKVQRPWKREDKTKFVSVIHPILTFHGAR